MHTEKLIGAKNLAKKKAIPVIVVFLLAALVGYQIYDPSKRVIEAVTGIVFVTIIARYPLTWSLSFFILMYPFPFALRVGTSNVVFLPLLLIIWLIRISLRNVDRPTGSILDGVIIAMTISYIVSFYNNPGGPMLRFAIMYFLIYLSSVGLFYLVVNFARDRDSLERIVLAGILSCFLVALFSILEMIFPGKALVPGWLYTAHRKRLVMQNVRIEGPFYDFELLAEFLALNIPIILLFFVRAKRMLFKYAYFILIILCIGILMATSTRGAFISLFFGAAYMLWVVRKDLNIVRITYAVIVTIALVAVTETLVAKYTISGGMMNRLMGTKFVGFIPDTRKYAWPAAIARAKEHLIIGHSPSWDFSRKLEKWHWPHNGYLFYLNITGIFGLVTFLALLYKLIRTSIKLKAKSMFDSSFPRALMLVLHVDLVIFAIDEIKIDYLRNQTYVYFVWYLFGLVAATHNVITKEAANQSRPRAPG